MVLQGRAAANDYLVAELALTLLYSGNPLAPSGSSLPACSLRRPTRAPTAYPLCHSRPSSMIGRGTPSSIASQPMAIMSGRPSICALMSSFAPA